MGIFDELLGIAQKPQSIAAGAFQGAVQQLTGQKRTKAQREQHGINKMLDELEEQGIDTTQWSGLRAADQDTSNIFSGALAGAKGSIRPSDVGIDLAGGDPNADRGAVGKGTSMALDLLADPLLAAGPLAKAGKLGKLAEGAATVGKVEDLTRGQKLAQFGRQMYQGQLLSGGDPLTGIAAGLGGRQVENAAVKYGPAIARRFAKQGVSQAAEEGAGAAEQLALPPGRQPIVPEEVAPVGPFSQGPTGSYGQELRQLGPGPGNVFEQGPVGSTGLGRDQMAELMQSLSNGPRGLPPASAIPMGPAPRKLSQLDLLEMLREMSR